MMTKYHAFVQRVLDRAANMPTTQRERFLARVEAARPGVQNDVRSLLPYYERATGGEPLLRADAVPNAAGQRAAGPRPRNRADVLRAIRRPPFNLDYLRVVEFVGMGGMGLVYRAEHPTLNRSFAVKMLRPGLTWPGARARFAFEIELLQNLRRVRHPSIPSIEYAGQFRDRGANHPFYVMEFIRGTALTQYAEAHGLSFSDRLRLFARVCEAMAAAHRYDIVHRDLKPDNILVTDSGEPKILDFGIAGVTGLETIATREERGKFVGTLRYASPEQRARRNDELAPASDVYSLGFVGVELLTGARPGEGRIHVRERILQAAAERGPRSSPIPAPEVAFYLTAILANALQREPSRRYRTAAGLCRDVELLLARMQPAGWRDRIGHLVGRGRARSAVSSTALDRPLRSVLRKRITIAMQSGFL